MSDNVQYQSSGGISFFGALFLIFLILKLTGHITWSWWYVTMPLWGNLALVVSIMALFALSAGVVLLVAAVVDWFNKKKKKF